VNKIVSPKEIQSYIDRMSKFERITILAPSQKVKRYANT
jgi:hypothetical protein